MLDTKPTLADAMLFNSSTNHIWECSCYICTNLLEHLSCGSQLVLSLPLPPPPPPQELLGCQGDCLQHFLPLLGTQTEGQRDYFGRIQHLLDLGWSCHYQSRSRLVYSRVSPWRNLRNWKNHDLYIICLNVLNLHFIYQS